MDTIEQLDKVIEYLYSNKPKKFSCNEIRDNVFGGDTSVAVDEIMNHLSKDYYLELELRGINFLHSRWKDY